MGWFQDFIDSARGRNAERRGKQEALADIDILGSRTRNFFDENFGFLGDRRFLQLGFEQAGGDLFKLAQLGRPRQSLAVARQQRGALDNLDELLTQSALGQASPGALAATRTAANAAGGRGLAFSTAAGALASRAGEGIAAQQASTLGQALATARLEQAQFGQRQAGLESTIEGQIFGDDLRLAGAVSQFQLAKLGIPLNIAQQRQQALQNLVAGAQAIRGGLSQAAIGAQSQFTSDIINSATQITSQLLSQGGGSGGGGGGGFSGLFGG